MGELRERRRVADPVLAAIRRMVVPALIHLVALVVIALAYTEDSSFGALGVVAALFGVVLAQRQVGVRHGVPYFVVGPRRVAGHAGIGR